MTKRQRAYREYLTTEHWSKLRLAALERDGGVCVKCGSDDCLQVHHLVYRTPWESAVLGDLETVCQSCHEKAHGIRRRAYMLFRDDERFSRIIDRVDRLGMKVCHGEELNGRELRFLLLVWQAYPADPADGCMAFHVCQVFDHALWMRANPDTVPHGTSKGEPLG